jgi:mannose-1-phosphate guanylyltransferase
MANGLRADMKAIVLAGGFATRLRPISYTIPKLLFPVLGKSMVYWTLDLLRECGVDEAVLGVNYLADSLRARVGKDYKGMRIKYSLEDKPLGTAGPIKLASNSVRLRDTFVAMNGDVIAQINLTQMLKHHRNARAAVTDALHEVRDPSRFGVVQLDSASRIERFVEKPTLKKAPSRMINAGIYMIEPSVLGMIRSGRRVSLEREIFPVLAKRHSLVGFPFEGYWFDIGDFSDYRRANFALLAKQGPRRIIRHEASRVAAPSRLVPPLLLGEDSSVEKAAVLGPQALLGKDCLIMKRARVTDSILFDRVTVGIGSTVSGAIVASDVSIGDGVKIEPGTVVSSNVQIRDGVRIRRNAIIHPHKEVAADVGSRAHIM